MASRRSRSPMKLSSMKAAASMVICGVRLRRRCRPARPSAGRAARPRPPRACGCRAQSRPRGSGPTARRPKGCRRRGCRGRGSPAGSPLPVFQRLDHAEPPLGRVGQRLVGRHGEVGVAADLGAADATAQLVELGQAELVGAMDDQGVGGRDVQPALDDVGGDQDVELAVVEVAHHRSRSVAGIWPLAIADLELRDQLLQVGGQLPWSLIRGQTKKDWPPR